MSIGSSKVSILSKESHDPTSPAAPGGSLPTSGLYMHFDAGQITSHVDLDPIAQWDDLSGNGFHATQAGSNKPIYRTTETINGLPTVEFTNTSNLWFELPSVGPGFLDPLTSGEVMIVLRAKLDKDPGSPGLFILHSGAASLSTTWPNSDGTLYLMFSGGTRYLIGDSDDFSNTLTNKHLLNIERDENAAWRARVWEGGTRHVNFEDLTPGGLNWGSGATLGSNRRNTGRDANSYWAEFVMWDHALTSGERAQALAYFNDKYGLGGIDDQIPVTNGLFVHLDAMTLSPGAQASWPDQSGNGNTPVQAVSGQQPVLDATGINGKPAVRFDATLDANDQYLEFPANTFLPMNLTPEADVFAVLKMVNDPGVNPDGFGLFLLSQNADTGGSNAMLYPFTNNSIYWECFTQSRFQLGDTSTFGNTLTNPHLMNMRVETAASGTLSGDIWEGGKQRLDIKQQGVGLVSPELTNASIGVSSQNFNWGGNFWMSEFIVYDRSLTNGERADVINYLKNKWSLNIPDPEPAPGADDCFFWLDFSREDKMYTDVAGSAFVTNDLHQIANMKNLAQEPWEAVESNSVLRPLYRTVITQNSLSIGDFITTNPRYFATMTNFEYDLPITVFVVAKWPAAANTNGNGYANALFDGTLAGGRGYVGQAAGGASNLAISYGGSEVTNSYLSNSDFDTWFVLGYKVDATGSCDMWGQKNGSGTITQIHNGTMVGTHNIGASNFQIGKFFQGDSPQPGWHSYMGELIFYDKALSDSDIQTAIAALATKWGIT